MNISAKDFQDALDEEYFRGHNNGRKRGYIEGGAKGFREGLTAGMTESNENEYTNGYEDGYQWGTMEVNEIPAEVEPHKGENNMDLAVF